jgi:membrane-associated protease RseP (regulator of RpoE activity)
MAEDGIIDEIVKFQNNTLTIQASKIPLTKILSAIQNKCLVKITGLEHRRDEKITFFSNKGSPERVLKDFLRHLGEKNYAFEYGNEALLQIVVLPGAKADNYPTATLANQKENLPETVKAVRVVGVIDGSQAQSAGLMKGDIILEYGGLKISGTEELIKATKTKTNTDQVEILVLRENYRLRFILNGGLIGVRITNATISKESLHK